MVRNFVAVRFWRSPGRWFRLPEPAFAGARGGAMPAFRPAMMHAARPHFSAAPHRPFAPLPVRHHARAPPHGASRPRRTAPSSRRHRMATTLQAPQRHTERPHVRHLAHPVPRFARMTLSHPRAHLARRHHRVYYAGWGYPVTYGGDGWAISASPYDPAEGIPVYGPATSTDVRPETARPPRRRALPARARTTANACRSERVTVPASEGEREITVVRC